MGGINCGVELVEKGERRGEVFPGFALFGWGEEGGRGVVFD